MTDAFSSRPRSPARPVSGHYPLTGSLPAAASKGRWWGLRGWVGGGVLLVPMGLWMAVGTLLGRGDAVYRGWRWLVRVLGMGELVRGRRPGVIAAAFSGMLGLAVGLLSWFLVMLLLVAIVRGPFYGFVEDGPFGPGTWGGPTKAGAWAAHAAISVPIIVGLPFVLRGLGLLQAAVIRRLYGAAVSRLVLPATILLALAGGLLFFSWVQQL